MSLEQHAFLRRCSVPSREAWQTAILRLGFDMQLGPNLNPFEDSGFLPCKLAGNDSGFEIYYDPAAEVSIAYPGLKDKIAGRDYSISFRWGGDMIECACVLIASAALAKSFDAAVYCPGDNLFYGPEDLVREAQKAVAQVTGLSGDTH